MNTHRRSKIESRRRIANRRRIPGAAFLLLFAFAAVPAGRAEESDGEGERLSAAHQGFSVAGSDCASCHRMEAETPAGLRASAHPDLDCETCHYEPEVAAVGAAICLECHDRPAFSWTGSVHPPVAEGACLDCHAPHASAHRPLLLAAEPARCEVCHGEVVSALSREHPHPVAEECSTCHGGHQGEHPRLLVTAPRALCVDCHDDPRESGDPLVHRPAAAGCVACHDPHGSDHPGMLAAPTGDLCGVCHPAAAAGTDLPEVHDAAAAGDCTGCHRPLGTAAAAQGHDGGVTAGDSRSSKVNTVAEAEADTMAEELDRR